MRKRKAAAIDGDEARDHAALPSEDTWSSNDSSGEGNEDCRTRHGLQNKPSDNRSQHDNTSAECKKKWHRKVAPWINIPTARGIEHTAVLTRLRALIESVLGIRAEGENEGGLVSEGFFELTPKPVYYLGNTEEVVCYLAKTKAVAKLGVYAGPKPSAIMLDILMNPVPSVKMAAFHCHTVEEVEANVNKLTALLKEAYQLRANEQQTKKK